MLDTTLVFMGIMLIVLGAILVALSLIMKTLSSEGTGKPKGGISGGGAIIIGPIPIIFGSSGRAVLIASIIAAIITLILTLLYLKSYIGW